MGEVLDLPAGPGADPVTRSVSLNVDITDDALLPRVLEVLGRSLAGLVMEGLDAWIFAGTGEVETCEDEEAP